eukprot:4602316-Prymnesium_polylepis.1
MFLIVLVAFSSGFFVLFKDIEMTGNTDLLEALAPCGNYEVVMDSWYAAFGVLMEAMLAQDGDAHCYRATSQPVVATGL